MTHPSVFYKYASSSTALIVLENAKLRWSSPLLFNDVGEFQRMPRFEPTVAQAHQLFPGAVVSALFGGTSIDEARLGLQMKFLFWALKALAAKGDSREQLVEMLSARQPDADDQIASALRELLNKADLKQARVLCLTTDHSNHAMWGNYAESHAGCVLGFRHVEELSTPLLAAKEVSYSQEHPVVGSGLDFLLYGDSPELREKTLQAICFTKTPVWSYEREWRVLDWCPDEVDTQHSDYSFYPDELESVTLGVRASESMQAKVRQLLEERYPATTLYRMSATHGELSREALSI